MDHMPAKEKDCFVEIKERVEKLLTVVKNEKSTLVLLERRVSAKVT